MSDVSGEGVMSIPSKLNKWLSKWGTRLLLFAFICMLIIVGCVCWVTSKPTYTGPTSRVLVTSSKITGVDGYTQVYSDEVSDYAIYVSNEYSAAQLPVKTTVQVGGYSGTVTETHDSYFTVRGVAFATPLLPGTVVLYDGEAVGFVSTQAGGLLTCRYY